jgi:enoyl-CoA hydratase
VYGPEAAVDAGFLDRAVGPADLHAAARDAAARLAQLDLAAHAASKLRARGPALRALRQALDADSANFRRRALAAASA